jgi:hypothetical protein
MHVDRRREDVFNVRKLQDQVGQLKLDILAGNPVAFANRSINDDLHLYFPKNA